MQLCVKFLSHIPFTELVFFRSLISIVLSLGMIYKLRINPLGNNRKFLVLRGVFGVTALSLFFYTLQKLPIATAITIQYLSPILTSVFAIWILKEPVPTKRWLFFGISFLGILVMKGFNPDLELKYFIAGLISAVFSGLAYNMIRKVKDTDHPVVVVLYFPLIATPVMAVVSLFYWVTPVGLDWLYLLLMGIFTQIAQVYMTKGWQSDKAGKIAGLKYIGIGFALFFDFSIFGIVPSWQVLGGIALVLSGVLMNVYLVKD
jgi:drug/metabolite transporter (DMT)-like permease